MAEKKDDKKLIEEARTALKECIDDEAILRKGMKDDLHFCTLDQWPTEIRQDRENVDQEGGPRPCLTIDKINQYIVQVVNDMRQGKPGINVRPQDDSADVATAKILKGLIRNIEDQSNADIAYATGGESAAKIGLGFWRITTEYVSDDSFDQDIFIRPIPNTFSVYLSRHIMPDGSDAKKGFIIEVMPLEKFKAQYPNAKYKGEEFSGIGEDLEFWHTSETVTVIEYFCLDRIDQTIYFLADGTTIPKSAYDTWPKEVARPEIQDERPSFREQLRWAKMTGVEVLEKRDLPGKYIPIVEVIGRESHIDGKRILWGLVKPAKDSLRMYNYFASAITEKMGLAPLSPFIAAEGQIEGREAEWKAANRSKKAVLQYKPVDVNGNALPAPQRQGATPIEAALLNQMQVIEHDVQTSLGMFKAAVGETESQQSGRAILALQRESDTGTYHFGANQGVSIRHTGRIILDLIPHYYDSPRIVRILGEDGEVMTAKLDPSQEQAVKKINNGPEGIKEVYNPTVGKYDVSITVGPSYNTKRMEAAATLTEVVKSQPQLMPLIGDLLFRSLDFPYSDQIAERLKKMLPPPLQDQQDPAAQLMQAMQKMQQMGVAMQEMQQENLQLKAGAVQGMAKVKVDEAALQEKARLAREEADAALRLQKEKQDKEAQLARDKALDEFLLKQECERRDCEHAKEMQDKKHALERERLDFEKQCHAEEKMKEVGAENESQAAEIAPKLVDGLQAIVGQFADVIAQQQKGMEMIVKELAKPKTVKLGNIQRGSEGITGASATVQ